MILSQGNGEEHKMSYANEIEKRFEPIIYSLTPDFSKTVLRLEVTNICNHACIFCPHSKQKRQQGYMNHETMQRLIMEAGELGIPKLALFLNGEPFLNERLAEYVKLAKEVGISFVFTTTNGTGVPVTKYYEAMEAGLDSLKFSINAGSRETYRLIHGRDTFDEAVGNFRKVREYRDSHNLKCRLLSGFIVTRHTVHEVEKHEKLISEIADDNVFSEPDNFGGYMNVEVKDLKVEIPDTVPKYVFNSKKLPCTMLFNSINVTWEGYLTLCCSEALNMLVVDDINNKTIRQVWYSDKMKQLREENIEGVVSMEQCRKCMLS